MPFTQDNRLLQVIPPGPLVPNDLILTSLTGREEMSRLFSFQLELISHKKNITPDQIVGKPLTFSVEQSINNAVTRRHFSGFVNRFTTGMFDESDKGEGIQHYHAEVVPWLWFLTRTSDCRIFQNKTVLQIIEEVFADNGFSGAKFFDISDTDAARHRPWVYCVQYRETDFNFVSRLMEQEGLYYYFKPVFNAQTQAADHVMCIRSKKSYIASQPATLDFKTSTGETKAHDGITSWVHEFEFRPGKWMQNDYDHTNPRASDQLLRTDASLKVKYANEDKFEMYDYPGEYEVDDGAYNKAMTENRQEEDEVPQDVVHATANVVGISPGVFFTVGEHPNSDEKGKQYVVTSIQHSAQETSLQGGGRRHYTGSFSAIPEARTFRTARITAKPSIQGTQTAIVVGPPGKEIHTDNEKNTSYMQVKVHFPWDRKPANEDSSCWIRVAQFWAGKNWGAMFIPRIGQEVVVAYLEGDPDRPLIVGSVYNHDQKPAYLGSGRDSKHTHDPNLSGIKSNSTLGGDGFNELRFNDTKDKEQIFIHAQKDLDIRVRATYRQRVYGNKHVIIGWEKDGKKGGDLRELIYQDKHLHVMRHATTHIEGNSHLKVGYGEGGGDWNADIEKNRNELVGEGYGLSVGKDMVTLVGGKSSLLATGEIIQEAGPKMSLQAGEIHIKGGMKVVIEAGMQLSLKGPGGFVNIGPTGVDIQGTLVNINSGGSAASASPTAAETTVTAGEYAPTKPDQADDSKTGFKSAY